MKTEEIGWINYAKGLAIIAVLVNHTYNSLYFDDHFLVASFFNNSVFIMVSGYLCFFSNKKRSRSYLENVTHSLSNVLLAYTLATFIYQVYDSHCFDLEQFLIHLVHFDASTQFHYICLFIQLMLVNKPLYIVTRTSFESKFLDIIKDIILGVILIFLSYFSVNYTNILNVYGGGGKLLGGTYIIIYYLGMLLAKYHIFDKSNLGGGIGNNTLLIKSLISIFVWILWYLFMYQNSMKIDSKLPFGEGYNPPSISIAILGFITFITAYELNNMLHAVKIIWVYKPIEYLGKHTLYIYLYHILFLNLGRKYVLLHGDMFEKIMCYIIMIGGSIALEYSFNWLAAKYKLISA